jgi:hypothetical protein
MSIISWDSWDTGHRTWEYGSWIMDIRGDMTRVLGSWFLVSFFFSFSEFRTSLRPYADFVLIRSLSWFLVFPLLS